MPDAEGIQHIKRAFKAPAALVHTVVVGSGEDVKAGLVGSLGNGIGGREAGIARVGLAGQGHFEVEYSHVSRLDIVLYILETRRIVIAPIGLQGGAVQRHMAHQVAGKDESQVPVALLPVRRSGGSKQQQPQHNASRAHLSADESVFTNRAEGRVVPQCQRVERVAETEVKHIVLAVVVIAVIIGARYVERRIPVHIVLPL